MDPLSQAVIGSGLAMCAAPKSELRSAAWVGALAGMAPDLDVLIRSSVDPLLAIEYHRHFTHSLLMAPVIGAAIGSLLWLIVSRWKKNQKFSLSSFLLYGILGTLTHGLLDACTSYGTQLLWPFSNLRVAWNNVGIIDPIPTLTLLFAVCLSVSLKQKSLAVAGTLFFVAYLGFGVVQRNRASEIQSRIREMRGHEAQRASVKPTIFNLIVFRSLYESNGEYHLDAIRVPLFGASSFKKGDVVPVFDFKEALSALDDRSPQKHDLERWAWFSDDYLSQTSDGLLTDIRYSMLPESSAPMWGIRMRPEAPAEHVEYWLGRNVDPKLRNSFFDFLLYGTGGQPVE